MQGDTRIVKHPEANEMPRPEDSVRRGDQDSEKHGNSCPWGPTKGAEGEVP